jgi:outer membrane lipase/esterase
MSHSLLSCVQKTAVTLTAVSTLAFSQLSNAAFSQIISFGDSLSDTGNVALATGGASPNPAFGYVDGHFSNGDIWLDYLSDSLNTGAQSPSNAGGTNHAWGGARTTVTDSVPSAQAQVAGYLASNTVDPNALYTILIGGNDINAFDGATYGTAEIAADAQAVAGIAQSLITAGAQSIMVLNVPDVGAAPVAPPGFESTLTGLSALYNGNLAAGLAGLDQNIVTLVDLFTIGQTITANVGSNGLDNVSDACLSTSGICATPDTYLYWDALHPTTAAHALIADAALATVVPVPAALPLMIFALSGLVGARKLRA